MQPGRKESTEKLNRDTTPLFQMVCRKQWQQDSKGKNWSSQTERPRDWIFLLSLAENKTTQCDHWRFCATGSVCAAQQQCGLATAGPQTSINSLQHILMTWPTRRTSLLFYSLPLFLCCHNLLGPFHDPPLDILGRRGAESWAGWPWIQNPGRPRPVQRAAGSGHALWGEGRSTFDPEQLHVLSSNYSYLGLQYGMWIFADP